MRLDIHFHPDEETAKRLVRLEHMLGILNEKMEIQMANMQDLQDAVARNTSAEQSVVTLLNGIAQQLRDAQAQNDPAAIQAVIDNIDANSKAMSDAVTANTPQSQS